VLEANALQRVVQLDVDAQIVRIELELVARLQAGVFIDVEGQRRGRAVDRKLPVAIALRRGIEGNDRVEQRAAGRSVRIKAASKRSSVDA
jgi:hypothetical protein